MSLPAYGTAQIECARRRCDWTGKETDMARKPDPKIANATTAICPKCGGEGYFFVKNKPAKGGAAS